jgi:hypothetical protein
MCCILLVLEHAKRYWEPRVLHFQKTRKTKVKTSRILLSINEDNDDVMSYELKFSLAVNFRQMYIFVLLTLLPLFGELRTRNLTFS